MYMAICSKLLHHVHILLQVLLELTSAWCEPAAAVEAADDEPFMLFAR